MVSWTRPALPRLRLRLAFLEEAKWRSPGLRRRSLPDAVILNRFAAAFFVFRRAIDLGMGRRMVRFSLQSATLFWNDVRRDFFDPLNFPTPFLSSACVLSFASFFHGLLFFRQHLDDESRVFVLNPSSAIANRVQRSN